jgi:hypothetical protein
MRAKAFLVAAISTLTTFGAVATHAYDAPSCFWGRPNDPNVINVAYPDEGATYWAAQRPTVPPGGYIELHGTYPHARYMSFNVYNQEAAPSDALADIEIAPDAGSANPFVAGADRTSTARSYTLYLKMGPRPAEREPNTMYLSLAGQGSPVAPIMLYRIYVADAGRNLTGDAGLPSAALHLADGTVINLTAACNPADANSQVGSQLGGVPIQPLFADQAAPGTPATFPAHDPIVWEKFFNLPHTQASLYTYGTPAHDLVDATLGGERGGYLSNAHNAYIAALGNRGYGPLLLVRGKAPTTPLTRAGAATMGDGQLRYWSLCTNERHSTRYIDCVWDEDVPVDANGFYTIVISALDDKPCDDALDGAVWLKWGTSPEVTLIMRHMLPSASFDEAIQRIAHPGEAAAVMGAYLPTGSHTSQAAFEDGSCSRPAP